MSLLAASALAYTHPGQPERLFTDITFEIAPGDRVGLLGPNGTGKSTLLRLLTGELVPDAGHLVRRRELRVAYVPQQIAPTGDESIEAHALAADAALAAMRHELAVLAADLEDVEAATRYGELLDDYQAAGGYAHEALAERVLAGLGFDARERALPLAHASSGQRTRAALARLLLAPADLFLLDEPTNHLDLAAREWLAGFLARRPEAFVLVSHDRMFLEAATTRVFELRRGALTCYEGTYAFYREQRALAERQAWERFHAQQRRAEAAMRAAEAREALARKVLVTPPGVRTGKDFFAAKAAKIEKTAKILRERPLRETPAEKPRLDDPIPVFDFAATPRSGDLVLAVRGLGKGYGDRPLFSDLTLDLGRGDRLAILGPNGAGKTTLLRVLAGLVAPDAGTATWGAGTRWAYFAQEAENLEPAASPLQLLAALDPDETRVRTLLACMRLRGERAHQPVGSMSAGERAKVAIARLIAGGANVLLLDEPTNHLDLDAREAVEATLARFPGTIAFVSHDRRFIEALATHTLVLGG